MQTDMLTPNIGDNTMSVVEMLHISNWKIKVNSGDQTRLETILTDDAIRYGALLVTDDTADDRWHHKYNGVPLVVDNWWQDNVWNPVQLVTDAR